MGLGYVASYFAAGRFFQPGAALPLLKRVLTLLLLAGSTVVAYGQGRDMAFAVHQLFMHKRHVAGASVAGGTSLVSEAATLNGAVQGTLVGAAPVLLGLRQAQRFSAEQEEIILSRYAAGWPIPADVRKQLRRKYFHRTAQSFLLTPH